MMSRALAFSPLAMTPFGGVASVAGSTGCRVLVQAVVAEDVFRLRACLGGWSKRLGWPRGGSYFLDE